MASISFLKWDANKFCGNMENIKLRWSQSEVSSKYNPRTTNAHNTISYNLYEACRAYAGKGREAFVGKIAGGHVAELMSSDNTTRQIVYVCKKNNEYQVYACTSDSTNPEKATLRGYIIETDGIIGYSGTCVLLALMPDILKDREAKEFYDNLLPFLSYESDDDYWNVGDDTQPNLLAFSKALAFFSDNVYRRINNMGIAIDAQLNLPTTQREIKMLHSSIFKKKVSNPIGKSFFFETISLNTQFENIKFENTTFTEDEKKKIPVMPASFQWNDWITKAAQYIKISSKYSEPIRTCYFIGPAGCGKSLGTVAIASLLGIPYDHITCQSDMEIFDFLGQIFPNTDPTQRLSFDEIRIRLGYPSVEDIIMDREGSYIRLNKKECPEDVTEQDIICDMINRVNKAISEMANSKDYTYIEGGLVKAIRYGYAFEIQEIGIVKRAGVAVGLNALLESGKNNFITLPTGEVIKKHENCVILFTSNDEYEGTQNLNQSVLSRMGHVVWFKNASAEEMAKRTKGIVHDFPDDKLLLDMANAIADITEFCNDKGISDGVCGQRELTYWAMEIMMEMEILGEEEISDEIIRSSCQTTVLNKVSQRADDIAEVCEGIINPKWGDCEIRI